MGPLDGSLYAKVVKNEPKQVIGQESATGTPSVSGHSPLRYIDPSAVSAPSGGQRRHLYGADLVRFVNSAHVASTDSGISSAGVVPRSGLNPRSGDLVFGGGSSASPPHSAESAATHYTDPLLTPTTPSPIRLSDPSGGSIVDTSAASSGSCPMPSLVETRAEIHRPKGKDILIRQVPPVGLTSYKSPRWDLCRKRPAHSFFSGANGARCVCWLCFWQVTS